MRVKFTNTLTQLNDREVLFGTIVAMMTESFVIQIDGGGRCIINPNSDYNFGFIPNEEADRKYAEALNRLVDELDADPEFDSAGFSIADRFEDEEEGTHHCDDPGCNCSI